jgi:hypothetical protein
MRELLEPERERRRLLRYVSRSWRSKEESDGAFRQSVEDERSARVASISGHSVRRKGCRK